MPTLTDADPAIPELPEPYTVASTIKCTACGAPYKPTIYRHLLPLGHMTPPHTCKCGSNQFGGTVGYSSPSPAQFTADQMNTRWLDGYAAGRASRVLGEAVAKIEDGQLIWSRLPKNADALLYTAPQAETLAVAERERFEAWALHKGYAHRDMNGFWFYPEWENGNALWQGWSAAKEWK
jgi:hypothetical protein